MHVTAVRLRHGPQTLHGGVQDICKVLRGSNCQPSSEHCPATCHSPLCELLTYLASNHGHEHESRPQAGPVLDHGCWPQDHPERYPAHKKVASVLTSVAEELQDMPLYYDLHALCKTVHCSPPPADVLRSAIVNAGQWPPGC